MLPSRLVPFLAVAFSLTACSSGGGGLTCIHDSQCNTTGYLFCNLASSRCEEQRVSFWLSVGYWSDQANVAFVLDPSVTAAGVQLLLDGAAVGQAELGDNGWTYQLDATDLSEGTHYLRGVAQVGGKDVYSTEYEWQLSRAPRLVSQTPVPNAEVPASAPVVLVFDEPVTVEKDYSSVTSDGVDVAYHVGRTADGLTLVLTWDHPERLGHSLGYSVFVEDAQANGITVSSTFTLESPQVTLTYPTSDVTTSGAVSFYASVSGSPEKVEVLAGDGAHINGVVLGTMSVSSGTGSFTWDTTSVAPGTYPVWLRAVRGGWAVTSSSVSVTVTK